MNYMSCVSASSLKLCVLWPLLCSSQPPPGKELVRRQTWLPASSHQADVSREWKLEKCYRYNNISRLWFTEVLFHGEPSHLAEQVSSMYFQAAVFSCHCFCSFSGALQCWHSINQAASWQGLHRQPGLLLLLLLALWRESRIFPVRQPLHWNTQSTDLGCRSKLSILDTSSFSFFLLFCCFDFGFCLFGSYAKWMEQFKVEKIWSHLGRL